MADLYITEYSTLARDSNGQVLSAGMEPAITTQVIANPVASTQSATLNDQTYFVVLHADGGDVHVLFGTNPTASTSKDQIAAGETRFYGVQAGAAIKIAAINGV